MKLSLCGLFALLVFACAQPSTPPEDALTTSVGDVLAALPMNPSDIPVMAPEFLIHKPRRESTFVRASIDTRSTEDIAKAGCGWPEHWYCSGPRPVTFMAGPGSSPIIPNAWTVGAWFVNKSSGSNSNNCTTALTACQSKQEIWVHRLGCGPGSFGGECPRFQQTTVIEQDASDTDTSDPLYFHVASEQQSSFTVQGGPLTCTAAIFTLVAAKNTAAGTNSALVGSFSAGSPGVGKFIQNTTAGKTSNAWVYKSAGGANWTLSQPLVPQPPGTQSFTEVNTWATNDTVNVCTPVAVNVIHGVDELSEFNGGFTNGAFLYRMTIFDPTSNQDNLEVGDNVNLQEVFSSRFVNFEPTVSTAYGPRIVSNSFLSVGAFAHSTGVDPSIQAGVLGSTGQFIANTFSGNPTLGDDLIIGFTTTFGQFGAFALPAGSSGATAAVYLDAGVIVSGNLLLAGNSCRLYGSGSGSLGVVGRGHVDNGTTQTFQTVFTAPSLVTGTQINGNTTACSATAAGVINCGITTTPAHLDAAAGATGFGSNAWQFGGASVSNF